SLTNSTVAVNRKRKFWPYVRISNSFNTVCQNTCFLKIFHPEFPIFSAHYSDCIINIFLTVDRVYSNMGTVSTVGIKCLIRKMSSDELQSRRIIYSRFWMG